MAKIKGKYTKEVLEAARDEIKAYLESLNDEYGDGILDDLQEIIDGLGEKYEGLPAVLNEKGKELRAKYEPMLVMAMFRDIFGIVF